MKPDVLSRPLGPASSKRTRYDASWVEGAAPRSAAGAPAALIGGSSGGELVERLEGDEPRAGVRRRLALQAGVAGAARVEDHERDREAFVLVGRVAPGVVELMKNVSADPTRAPLAVDGLGAPVRLDRHVVWVDLRPDAVEEDPPLASDGGRYRTCGGTAPREDLGHRLDDRAAELLPRLLPTLRDREGGGQDRLATSDRISVA